jgi:rod shape determining protein RodA
MLFVAGARTRHLVIIAILAVLVSPLLWHYGMKPYQRMRISSVLLQNEWLRQKAQENETLGAILAGGSSRLKNWDREAGYHLKHSKFAIASGGLAGYGFRHGPYIKYGQFLPERHNDFIFVLIGHQWGFVGCLLVLALYAVIIACGLEIAVHNTEPFGRLIAVGIVAMFAVEVLVNISMTLGLMPITGLTLPLVSYGGSSLMVSAAALGLLNNVGKSRPFSVAGEPFSYK